MVTVHLTEAELARDVHGVLDKVRHGMEVIIDDDSRVVAVIRNPEDKGSLISEVIAAFQAPETKPAGEEDWRKLDPPSWA